MGFFLYLLESFGVLFAHMGQLALGRNSIFFELVAGFDIMGDVLLIHNLTAIFYILNHSFQYFMVNWATTALSLMSWDG